MAKQGKGLGIFVSVSIVLLFIVLDAALAGSIALAVCAWLFDPFIIEAEQFRLVLPLAWPVLTVPVVLLLLRLLARRLVTIHLYDTPGPLDLAPIKYAAYTLFGLVCTAVGLELILVAAEVNEPLPVYGGDELAEGQLETGGFIEPDPFMLWKFSAGSNHTYGAINELGYLGDVPDKTKNPGTKRVVCLGGSTTCGADPSYPRILSDKLVANADGTINWEVYDLSVERYSIVQGLQVFRNTAAQYQPDYVTVYFGWDDHWRANAPDSERMAVRETSRLQRLMADMENRRIIQMIENSLNSERNVARKENPLNVRVPLAEYTWTLKTLLAEIKAAGAEPVVIVPAGSKIPRELVTQGLTPDLLTASAMHKEYNQATRQVAEENKALVIDYVEFINNEVPTRFAVAGTAPVPLFESDGMTLSHTGRTFLVEQLLLKIH